MAQSSGFFTAQMVDGKPDRRYTSTAYTDNLAAIISNGVRRSELNELRVTSKGGLALAVSIGRAWILGHWYKNDTEYTDLSVPTAPVGDRSRIDRVILRYDNSTPIRSIELAYLTGEPSQSPIPPTLTRTDTIYEIALADISVGAGVTSISQSNITDKRSDTSVCGWITSPIGYEDYFINLDTEFNEWFTKVRDELASVTMYKEYTQKIVTTSDNTSQVNITIPQYDSTGLDIVNVYVNGMLQESDKYTINDKVITFTYPKLANTEIYIVVAKSIDGRGLGSVSNEITDLQNRVADLNSNKDYEYHCNGYDDNIKLSDIAQAFLGGGSDYAQKTIKVYGNLGMSTPYAGDGTTTSRYRWFSLGLADSSNRRIIFDFENCNQINFTCEAGKHYIGFYGSDVIVRNVTAIANCNFSNSTFVYFSSTIGRVSAEQCRFWINANNGSFIAQTGNFRDCKCSVTNAGSHSYCFNVHTNGLLRLYNGEYMCYTGQSASESAVVNVASGMTNAVAITYGINCPTTTRSGYHQKHAINCAAGKGSFNDTITTLTINAPNQTIAGTITLSKPDRM